MSGDSIYVSLLPKYLEYFDGVDDPHLTLAYFGKADTVPPRFFTHLEAVCLDEAEAKKPIRLDASGIEVFDNKLVLTFDTTDELRCTRNAFAGGIWLDRTYPFRPHVTLGNGVFAYPMCEYVFDRLRVNWGRFFCTYPLRGGQR